MKVYSFNTLPGYEGLLTEKPEIVLFGAMLLPLAMAIVISCIGWLFRKLKLNLYIIQALLYTMLFSFFFGTVAVLILYFITDKNGVKLAYCWMAIITGMFLFSIINTRSINKMFTDWSHMIKN